MDAAYNQIINKIAAIYDGYEEDANLRSEQQRNKLGTQINKKQKQFLDDLNKIQELMIRQLKQMEKSNQIKTNNARECPRMVRQCLKDIQSITKKKALMFKVNDHLQTLIANTEEQVNMIRRDLPGASDTGFLCGGGAGEKKFKITMARFELSASQWRMLAQLQPKDSVENFVSPKFSQQQFSFLKKVLKDRWPEPKEPEIIYRDKIKEVVKEIPVSATTSKTSKVALANQFLYGINRQENPSYGLKLYHEQADRNDATACGFLGQVYEEGLFLPQNLNKAIQYYNRAIKANGSFAKYRYALATMKGKLNPNGISKNEIERGMKLLIESTQGADPCPEALTELGSFYEKGNFSWDKENLFTTTINLKKAIDLYRKARSLHSARASNNLGVLYFHNKKMDAANPNSKVTNESNVQNNLEKAKQYLEEAEVQGFSQAFFNLGCIYEQGLIGKKDEEKALKYFYNGGLKGDIQSKLKFSYHIMKQTCIMKEQYDDHYKLAQKWLDGIVMKVNMQEESEGKLEEESLKQKAQAMYYLGLMYEYGFGVQKSPRTAYSYFLQSSDLDYPSAKNKIGDCYFSGYGVQKDRQMAIGCYLEAADLNNLDAMVNLGTIYLNGIPDLVERDYNKAYNYFIKAMQRENTDALIHLSYMYKTGLGLDRNEEMAKNLLEEAAKNKNSTALYMLKEMGGQFDQRVLFDNLDNEFLAAPKRINLKQIIPVVSSIVSR